MTRGLARASGCSAGACTSCAPVSSSASAHVAQRRGRRRPGATTPASGSGNTTLHRSRTHCERAMACVRAGFGRPGARVGVVARATGFDNDLQDSDFALSSTDFDANKIDVLRQQFQQADAKGTGLLGTSEVRALLECAGTFCYSLHVMTEEETMQVIKKYDLNGDNKLDFEEFINFANDKLLLEAHLKNYEMAFKRLDRNGNGTLDVRELRDLFRKLSAEGSQVKVMTDKEVNHLVIKYGQRSRKGLTFEEFLIMARNVLPEMADIMKYLQMDEAPAAEEEAATDKEGEKKGKKGAFQQLFGMLENSLSTNVEILEKKKWQRKVVNEVRSMEEFQLLLQEEKGPIIMEVGFTFCKPCKKFEPKYKLFAEHYKDALFLIIYGNRNQSTKQLCKTILKVKATPTFYMYANGKQVDKHVGIKEQPLREKIIALIDQCK